VQDYEIWVSASPITAHGEIVDWTYGRAHYVSGGRTLCGHAVGGDRWEKASYRTGYQVDCSRCLGKVK
jgi:hypothetical protein